MVYLFTSTTSTTITTTIIIMKLNAPAINSALSSLMPEIAYLAPGIRSSNVVALEVKFCSGGPSAMQLPIGMSPMGDSTDPVPHQVKDTDVEVRSRILTSFSSPSPCGHRKNIQLRTKLVNPYKALSLKNWFFPIHVSWECEISMLTSTSIQQRP